MAISDEQLFQHAVQALKASGKIEYTGEFGAEIATFIPFVAWLKAEGLLSGRRVVTYPGMRPYYFFLDDQEYGEKPGPRHWHKVQDRDWPSNSTYTATRQRWHLPPDYRTHYRSQGRKFERPILFIQNKFAVEWKAGPINYLPLNLLQMLLEKASRTFDVVYSRPRTMPDALGYTADVNTHCEYPDLAIVRSFPDVLILEDFCVETGSPYNLTKLEILAKTHHFAAVQGGATHLLACFGDSMLLLFHRRGDEDPHAYASGPYKYLSTPPLGVLIARNKQQLGQGIHLLTALRHKVGGGFQIPRAMTATLNDMRI